MYIDIKALTNIKLYLHGSIYSFSTCTKIGLLSCDLAVNVSTNDTKGVYSGMDDEGYLCTNWLSGVTSWCADWCAVWAVAVRRIQT